MKKEKKVLRVVPIQRIQRLMPNDYDESPLSSMGIAPKGEAYLPFDKPSANPIWRFAEWKMSPAEGEDFERYGYMGDNSDSVFWLATDIKLSEYDKIQVVDVRGKVLFEDTDTAHIENMDVPYDSYLLVARKGAPMFEEEANCLADELKLSVFGTDDYAGPNPMDALGKSYELESRNLQITLRHIPCFLQIKTLKLGSSTVVYRKEANVWDMMKEEDIWTCFMLCTKQECDTAGRDLLPVPIYKISSADNNLIDIVLSDIIPDFVGDGPYHTPGYEKQ